MNPEDNKPLLAAIGAVVVITVPGIVVVLAQGEKYASLMSTRSPAERLPLSVSPPSFEIVDAKLLRQAPADEIWICARWRDHQPRELQGAIDATVSNLRVRELIGKFARWLPTGFDVQWLGGGGQPLDESGSGIFFVSTHNVIDPTTGIPQRLGPRDYMVDIAAVDFDRHSDTKNNVLLAETSECDRRATPEPSL